MSRKESNVQDLQTYLNSGGTLLADGATGTILQSMGLPGGAPPEVWNVERPETIRAHHRAYLDAGAQIILTNTFGGSRIRLEQAGGLGERTTELNQAAVGLAREAAGERAYVAGDIGPTGELLAPYGTLDYQEAVRAFAEQARALAESGVDLLWVETMIDLNEAKAAIEGARQVTALPIFCSFSFGRRGRTMMGVTPAQIVKILSPMALAGIGANCGEGIEPVVDALVEMRAALSQVPGNSTPVLVAKPNAGLPRLEDGQTVFDLGPEEMAAHVPRFVEIGAQVIGGCCGSSPAHIAAMASRLKDALRTWP
jgi:5-methyltetrahydrofolate--homocysteine methyltransferase